MRDALSTFDQIVSYSGNTLSYKSVIENLNILDYEYYFKVTDYLVVNDIFEILKASTISERIGCGALTRNTLFESEYSLIKED